MLEHYARRRLGIHIAKQKMGFDSSLQSRLTATAHEYQFGILR